MILAPEKLVWVKLMANSSVLYDSPPCEDRNKNPHCMVNALTQ
jgi:hypothetical protein